MNILKVSSALLARLIFWRNKVCNFCNHRVGKFLPYNGGWKNSPALMRVLDVVGSDLKNFECPWCGAQDRERHLLMYINAIDLFSSIQTMEILHFAPERRLSTLISNKNPKLYIKCDLFPSNVDVRKIDILDIEYPDNKFDIVIANHVLEHVDDELKALSEIRRILKPNGLTILQTPFSSKLQKTWQDEGIDNDEARRQAYGQKDHVRLFGKDIFLRIETAGFKSLILWHKDTFPDDLTNKFAVNVNEPFFLFKRKDYG